jgi:DtxR family Mn-dependent transcriptional regulator
MVIEIKVITLGKLFFVMNSLTEENYLKALYNIANEAGEVNVTELSKHLGIKMPTVTSMMKKLSERKLVHYESYKPLQLTEMFLVEKMKIGWEDVHDIAEQVEHIQSPVFFEKMDQLLDHPKVDPHGSPIPDKKGKLVWKEYNKLSDCKVGEIVRLAAVINTSSDFLKFLNARDMRLGLKIKIKSVEPFDKSLIVSYDKRLSEGLSNIVCERLLVEKV